MDRYLDWAGGLDTESLTALLRYVGEYGSICCWLKLETGEYPWPSTDTDNVRELRKHGAVVGIAMIFAGDTSTPEFQCANPAPVFPEEYRILLCGDKRTLWAMELDRKTFESLIWNVGEFGVRALLGNRAYAIPRYPDYPVYGHYLRSALYNIVRIFESCLKNRHRWPVP
jgi:hypothetical protein